MNKYLNYVLKKIKKFKKTKKDKKDKTDNENENNDNNLDTEIKVGSGMNISKHSNSWKITDNIYGNQPHTQVKSNGDTASSISVGCGVDNLNNAFNKLNFRLKKNKKPNF